MKFACDSCQTKYTIPDEKVRGKVLKIRCKKCNAVITVKEDPAAAAPEPELQQPPVEERTRVADIGLLEKLRQAEENRNAPAARAAEPAPPPPAAHEWFAMINGEQVGPLGPAELRARVDAGEVTDRSHVWRDGLADWKRAGEVDELQQLFAHPPLAVPAPAPAPAPRPRVAEPTFDDPGESTAAASPQGDDSSAAPSRAPTCPRSPLLRLRASRCAPVAKPSRRPASTTCWETWAPRRARSPAPRPSRSARIPSRASPMRRAWPPRRSASRPSSS